MRPSAYSMDKSGLITCQKSLIYQENLIVFKKVINIWKKHQLNNEMQYWDNNYYLFAWKQEINLTIGIIRPTTVSGFVKAQMMTSLGSSFHIILNGTNLVFFIFLVWHASSIVKAR